MHDLRYNQIDLKDGELRFDTEGGGLVLNGEVPFAGVSILGKTQSLYITDNYSVDVGLKKFPGHIFYPKSRTGEDIRVSSTGEVHQAQYAQNQN